MRGARRATSHPVPAGLPPHLDVFQNSELAWLRLKILWTFRSARVLSEFLRDRLSSNHALQVLLFHFLDPLQVRELILQLVVGAVEPMSPAPALPRSPMDA